MKENQNIEWKSSWRDEYIKWICGFANANGGMLEVGKDDHGTVVGIGDAQRLASKQALKRPAILLFHPEPEQFFTGAYVKIGYFRTDTDLRFQDEIHGPLFDQVEKTMDLLLSKYVEAAIRYEGISRVEEYP